MSCNGVLLISDVRIMKIKIFLILSLISLFIFINEKVCKDMRYHDYAAGIDRSFNCPWKNK